MDGVQDILVPTRSEKMLGAMKAHRSIQRITHDKSEAEPGSTLYVPVPRLNAGEVIVPASLELRFKIDLSGGHANNYLVDNVGRALVDKMVVKFGGEILQDTDGYGFFKIYEDLYLPKEERANRIQDGIQSETLNKIRSNAGDKSTSGVDAENTLNTIYSNRYRIRLDHEILSNHGVFYPHALYNDLMFEIKLAPAGMVVRGSDPTKLKYKLTDIEVQYEKIISKKLADEAMSAYINGKEFAFDQVQYMEVQTFDKKNETLLNIKVNPQKRSLKGVLLLFVEPYADGARESEKYFNPDITNIKVTVKGAPNRLYNDGLEGSDIWEEAKRFFIRDDDQPQFVMRDMDAKRFYTGSGYGVIIDLRSMSDQNLHGCGERLVDSKNGVHLQIKRTAASGSGNVNCHIFTISDAQMNIVNRLFQSVQV